MGEYSYILEQQGKTTAEKLAEFTAAIGWRDELATYRIIQGEYEMRTAAAAEQGMSLLDVLPYTDEELAALDAESAAYYEAFAANYVATAAFPGSGSGTQSDPYIITNRAELEGIADDLTAYYQLANDIDLGGSGSPWTPIGSISTPFSGTLDGNGHAISNLYLDITNRYFGLFSVIAGSTVSHVSISATATNEGVNYGDVGAIAGSVSYTNSPTSFVQCTISMDFSGTPVQNCFIGGIYSTHNSSNPSASMVQISDCVVDIQISVDTTSTQPSISAFGPIGTIYRSYATGSIQYLLDTEPGYQRGIGGISSGSRAGWVSVDSVVSLLTDIDAGVADAYRIVPVGSIVDAYANAAMLVNGNTVSGGTTTNTNGADVSASTYNTQAFWENTLGWDFDTVWYWDTSTNLPKLQAFIRKPKFPLNVEIGSPKYTTVSQINYNAGGIASVQVTPTTSGTTPVSNSYYTFQSQDGQYWITAYVGKWMNNGGTWTAVLIWSSSNTDSLPAQSICWCVWTKEYYQSIIDKIRG